MSERTANVVVGTVITLIALAVIVAFVIGVYMFATLVPFGYEILVGVLVIGVFLYFYAAWKASNA